MPESVGTWAALIAAMAAFVAALGGLIMGIRNSGKAEATRAEVISTKNGIFELGKRVDGRLTRLLELTEAAARAEGRLQGAKEEKARVKP